MTIEEKMVADLEVVGRRIDTLVADNRTLRSALRGLLAVSVPSEDPRGRTALAIKAAEKALGL